MEGWRTKKPSPSMVVALIALFVAMTGVATAGKGGAKLGKNSVKSSHIAPGAVGPTDLAAGAVTARGLATNSVPKDAIQNDAVDETKLAPSSVGAYEIQPEAVDPSKFAGPGSFPYARIDLEDPLPVPEFAGATAVPLEDYAQVKPPSMVNLAQPTRIYAPIAGRYSIKVRVAWAGGAETSSRGISVRRNNSLTAQNHVGSDGVYNVSPGVQIDQELNATFEFQPGDFIELFAAQSGAPPADNPVTLDRARVTMEWVGT
jgi:hypothetical protein